jgi:sec-independent protein translocase protein TatA
MPDVGPLELAIILVIVLVIFGPKRLPGLGRSLGSGMREFKDSITGKTKDSEEETASEPERATLPASETQQPEEQREPQVGAEIGSDRRS